MGWMYTHAYTRSHTHTRTPTWRLDACGGAEEVVLADPVLVLDVPMEADHLDPLGVVIDKLPRGGGPLLTQPTHVQLLILHRQPLRLEACRGRTHAHTHTSAELTLTSRIDTHHL